MNYSYLASPMKIGTMEVKNRTVMTAIVLQYGEPGPDGGYVNDQFRNFYVERAKGGVGLIIAGGVSTDKYVGYPAMLRLDDDRYISGMKEMIDAVHEAGSKICLQFLQTGRYGSKKAVYNGDDTISASAVPSSFSPDTPREMTKEDIKGVIENAAKTALRAKAAGSDGIEICANSGYMVSQFLSPVTNKRTDEYGGSLENRCRFGIEMITAIREAVGEDYPIILRVAGNQFMPGGYATDESIEFCKKAEAAGVNAIDVTGGWHETVIPQLPADVPKGGYVYLAEAIKRAVNIPVISSNRHNDPKEAERVLASGQADFIGQCRTLIADPEWPNKVLSGREKEVRACLACNQGCFANVFAYKPCKCLLNSYVGRESDEWKIQPAENVKKILVIGAGAAGCEFAYRAAARGHQVTIWEKDNVIGGQANIAALPPKKSEFNNIAAFHEAMLEKYNVNVVLGKEATKEEILEAGYDEVVIATGATPKRLFLDGADEIPVYTAEEILTEKEVAGKNVLVVGGGSVGCETADYLAHEAAMSPDKVYFLLSQQAETPENVVKMMNCTSRNITVIDMAKIAGNYDFGCGWPIRKDLKRLGVRTYGKSKIVSIQGKTVTLELFNRKTKETTVETIPCDTIVLAVGYESENGLYNKLKESGVPVHNIGDSSKVGKVMDAIYEADILAEKI